VVSVACLRISEAGDRFTVHPRHAWILSAAEARLVSIAITFYPRSASREELTGLLRDLAYSTCNHLLDWPQGSRHFSWYRSDDFVSFDGVEATVYPSETEPELVAQWLLHTRTRISASVGDREQQNETIRTARQRFGGWFHNDAAGKNRYIQIEPDGRDAVARGIFLSYTRVSEQLSSLRYALPDPNAQLEGLMGTKLAPLATVDPARVVYNALFPFAVAAIEHFFSQCFKIMLRYDSGAQAKLAKQNKKVEMEDVCAIRDGSKAIEDVVAEWYSFQSVASIHSAFSDWFRIDFRGLLRRRKKVGRKLPVLENRLQQLIEFRHGIVHRFSLDFGLRKPDIEETLDTVQVLFDLFLDEVERRRGVPIRDS
jgi:hypothetical protein